MAKPGFYAVRRGRQPGVYATWSEAEAQVKGFTGAVHKKFADRQSAEHYVNGLASSSSTTATSSLAATQAVQRPKRESPQDASKDTRPTKLAKVTASSGQARKDETRIVYCDGSSRGNGQKGAVAGIGVVWQQGVDASNLSERLPGKLQTNNRAEMYASPRSSTMMQHAVARILEEDPHPELPLTICSDSQYTISVFSQWIPSWRARNWKTSSGGPVMNKDLILYILSLIASRPSPDPNSLTSNISFRKVKAHVGIEANEEADRLANLGAFKPVTKDRDFAKEAKDMEDKVKRENKGIRRADSVEVEVEVDAGDLLTEEELRELDEQQNF
ncbi:BZ3500_MvSof-1268-A1-R1_Chr4-4g07473 [Microbotryum saponariae]|uniref:Ribonuclease H n=1 Tax=Microbotryum saponariae TaxID=289078 RepID=A0A2X0KUB2_9BASI|nr:BZ3500_MvSof-1268-A1-R1_Chr4-4g07473 [Microbotryum saponariae]SDA07134.1 BZ3501_MvSof-1269-A2-R1_Chr4-3g07181 [Microbotryum saponariae]